MGKTLRTSDRHTPEYRAKVARLNDAFRQSFTGGRVLQTAGVASLPGDVQALVLRRVATYADFDEGDDPWGEHDFGAFEIEGRKFFWKIDYYDAKMEFGSEDPSDPTKTTRVLTIMLAEEY